MTDSPTPVHDPVDDRAALAGALWPVRTGLSAEQVRVLLRPLNPSRIAHRSQGGKQLSYLEAWDVKAHLTRIFGFGGWDGEVLSSSLMFQADAEIGRDKKPGFAVGYQCIYRLRIKDRNGNILATYTEASIGQNSQSDLGEAHDTACKTAESDALKRCAINLGDQFGLSLYDDGSTRTVIKQTLVTPEGFEQVRKELTAEQADKLQHAVGHREMSEASQTMEGADNPVEQVHAAMRTAVAATPRQTTRDNAVNAARLDEVAPVDGAS